MNYDKDVEDDARDLLLEMEEQLKEAIKESKDWDYNDIDDLDELFHSSIVDRAYTPSDAGYIIENCTNEETDTGLWEGQDLVSQLSAMAAYSYGNDVWSKCTELYDELKENYEYELSNLEDKKEIDFEIEAPDLAANISWQIFKDSIEVEPYKKGSSEEKYIIERWLELNKNAGLWGGYPVGGSYIDSRCGTGHGMPEVKNFVDLDHELVKRCPHLSRMDKADVEEYISKL